MNVADFDYDLPIELIAQKPSEKRDESRLLVVNREKNEIYHKKFYDIIKYLNPGDCLVLNNSKVIPARMFGIKEKTGAKIEFLLTKQLEGDTWETVARPGKRLKPGDKVRFPEDVTAEILENGQGGTKIVKFRYQGVFMERLEEIGAMPLPPYIERPAESKDKDRYQTVYALNNGSVAAPTAGLHFTKELLEDIKEKGIKIAYVTLHVGIGTFRPVKAEKVEDHEMHFEMYHVSRESADLINETKAAGGRTISVGTTSTRTLESAVGEDGTVIPGTGNTDIFIYPGYKFKVIDAMVTNFHLPKSTLMMLISALYDREKILEIYQEAIRERYRFFSYGDAMFIY